MDTVADLHFNGGSIGGSGLGAFNVWGVDIRVEGGAQDGVGKTMFGGTIAVMKGKNRFGRRVNGSVGKSFAYGAQRGRFFVQGSADSRFCIRLSGADVVIAGEPEGPIQRRARRHRRPRQHQGLRVRVHDRRPRRRAGRHRPVGLRRADRRPRLHARQRGVGARPRGARAAARERARKVALEELDDEGVADVQELLGHYADELERSEQREEAERIRAIAADAARALPDVGARSASRRTRRFRPNELKAHSVANQAGRLQQTPGPLCRTVAPAVLARRRSRCGGELPTRAWRCR